MKIKQVCDCTGLTERTVRFYVEKGLCFPKVQRLNGRTYFDFSQQNIQELLEDAALRKADFSIQDIKAMRNHPERIPEVLQAYRQTVAENAVHQTETLEILNGLKVHTVKSLPDLVSAFDKLSKTASLPSADVSPDFGRLDGISREKRDELYEAYQCRRQKRERIGKVLVFSIAAINVISSLITWILRAEFTYLFTFLIQIGLSVALCFGIRWVRWLFAAGSGLSAVIALLTLFEAVQIPELPLWFYVYDVALLLFSIFAAVSLVCYPPIKEYFYERQTG